MLLGGCWEVSARSSLSPTDPHPVLSVGIYGVGKAALHPPALAVLSHTPEGATQTIAWVGKGIVYDTGGLSIKGKVRCWGRRSGGARGEVGAGSSAPRGFGDLGIGACLRGAGLGPNQWSRFLS